MAIPTALLCSAVDYVESQENVTALLVALSPAELRSAVGIAKFARTSRSN